MTAVVIGVALLGVLVVGLLLGLAWRGSLLVGDRRALDRLSAGLEAEQRMRAATAAAIRASRQAVRDHQRSPFGGGSS